MTNEEIKSKVQAVMELSGVDRDQRLAKLMKDKSIKFDADTKTKTFGLFYVYEVIRVFNQNHSLTHEQLHRILEHMEKRKITYLIKNLNSNAILCTLYKGNPQFIHEYCQKYNLNGILKVD